MRYVTAKLISTFVFATRIEQSLYFLNMEFQASGHFLWLYSPVCVGPGRKSRRLVFSERGSYGNSACQNFDNDSPIMCYQNTIKSYCKNFLFVLCWFIRITHLCNLDPIKHHFYTVKLGSTGVYITFLIFAVKHRLWVLVWTGCSNVYPQFMF